MRGSSQRKWKKLPSIGRVALTWTSTELKRTSEGLHHTEQVFKSCQVSPAGRRQPRTDRVAPDGFAESVAKGPPAVDGHIDSHRDAQGGSHRADFPRGER